MRRALSQISQQPFYLWFLGIYPIVHLYSENLGLVIDREVATSLMAMLVGTTFAFLVTNHFLKCRYKSAFMLSICSMVFSLSGHVYVLIFIPKSLFVWTLLVFIATAIILARLWKSKSYDFFIRATPVLNLLVLALLALPSLNVAYSIVTSSQSVHPVAAFGTNIAIHGESPKLIDSASRPDIYYIIPDGYPSDSWLQESMNYDNLNFTTELEDRGFLVAKHAQSNYSATLLSLASALNLHHYNSNPSSFADLDYLRVSIADSAVARRLQEIGYTYIQFLSGYLIPSPAADINRDFTPQGVIEIGFDQNMIPITKFIQLQTGKIRNNLELGHFYKRSFFTLYAETSALRLIVSLLNKLNFQNEVMPYDLFSPERFLAAIDEVASIASMPEATFTVVHLMKPHGPTVFDEKGEIIENIYVPSHQEYFSEFAFTNTKFLNMIDTLFELSENPPVIIFQGDHGSTYGDVWTADKRLTHFDTYAAYFLPDPFLISLPKPFTLINSFALILNELFDTEYDMQEDRLYELLDGYSGPFNQADVTLDFAHK